MKCSFPQRSVQVATLTCTERWEASKQAETTTTNKPDAKLPNSFQDLTSNVPTSNIQHRIENSETTPKHSDGNLFHFKVEVQRVEFEVSPPIGFEHPTLNRITGEETTPKHSGGNPRLLSKLARLKWKFEFEVRATIWGLNIQRPNSNHPTRIENSENDPKALGRNPSFYFKVGSSEVGSSEVRPPDWLEHLNF